MSLLFLVSTIGLTINSHYCGMKLRSVSLLQQGCCCKDKTGMKDDCCKNKINYVKVVNDYTPASELHLSKTDASPIVLRFSFVPKSLFLSAFEISTNHSPPPLIKGERFIVFHSILVQFFFSLFSFSYYRGLRCFAFAQT